MPALNKIKIAVRLAAGCGLMLVCAITLLVMGLWGMASLQEHADQVITVRMEGLVSALEMRETGVNVALALRKIATPTDASEAMDESKRLSWLIKTYMMSEGGFEKLATTGRARAFYLNVVESRKEVMPVIEKIKLRGESGDFFEAANLVKEEFLPLQERWIAALRELAKNQREEMREGHVSSRENYRFAIYMMLWVGALSIAIAAIVALSLSRSINAPLVQAVVAANAIAEHDLSSEMSSESSDEIGQLVSAIKKMQERLIYTVLNIRAGADQISMASEEIADGNKDLSERTESQASSLEQTAASMEEFTRTVKLNSESALLATQSVAKAAHDVVLGGRVFEEVIDTMELIRSSSSRVVDIISVIDSIAFQTNILALNAAVEAARAGEQGRGFSIVAAEVRNLAQRSATAAREIKELIGDAVEKIDCGKNHADKAGVVMRNILVSVQEASRVMEKISVSSLEQSSSLLEINRSISMMDKFTQKNATLVERVALNANCMREYASNLALAVAVFKVPRPFGSALLHKSTLNESSPFPP